MLHSMTSSSSSRPRHVWIGSLKEQRKPYELFENSIELNVDVFVHNFKPFNYERPLDFAAQEEAANARGGDAWSQFVSLHYCAGIYAKWTFDATVVWYVVHDTSLTAPVFVLPKYLDSVVHPVLAGSMTLPLMRNTRPSVSDLLMAMEHGDDYPQYDEISCSVNNGSNNALKLFPFQQHSVQFMMEVEACTGVHTFGVNTTFYDKVYLTRSNREVWVSRYGNTLSFVQPKIQRGGMLCDDMGLGKTVTVVALIIRDKQRPLFALNVENQLVPRRVLQLHRHLPQQLYASNITLIIVPSHLFVQWSTEISRHAPNLRTKYRCYQYLRDTLGADNLLSDSMRYVRIF